MINRIDKKIMINNDDKIMMVITNSRDYNKQQTNSNMNV